MSIKIETKEDLNTKMCIYKLVFPNNKIYIGQTITTLKHRLNGHIQATKRGLNTPIYNAIRKYKTFKVFILYSNKSLEELNILETKYILEFNSIVDNKLGYNSNYGGDNKIKSKESREKQRLKMIGRVTSEETKKKQSEAQKGLKKKPMSKEGKKNISLSKIEKTASNETKQKMSQKRLGVKLSEESKLKISEANKGRILTENSKIKISDSLKEYYKINTHPMKGVKRETFNNKLNTEQVLEIRSLLLEGKTTLEISEIFKVSQSTIQQIKQGKTWKSLGEFKMSGKASRLKKQDLDILYNLFDLKTSVKEIKSKLPYCISTIAKQRKIWKQKKKDINLK